MAHPLLAADVYNRIGGQDALVQLLDKAGSGNWDDAVLDLAMGDAWNYTVAAVGVQAELAGFTNDQIREKFPHLITVTAQKSLRFAWVSGSGGQAMPPGIEQIDNMAEAQIEKLAERRRKHGAVGFSPAPAQQIGQVDMNPFHDRMTLCGFRSSGGLC